MSSHSAAFAAGALALALIRPLGTERPDRRGRVRDEPLGRASKVSVSPAVRWGGAAAWLTTAVVFPGVPGIVLGCVVAVFVGRFMRRLEPAAVGRERVRRAADLPVALDLLAVCLRAGTPLVSAFETVAAALPGALTEPFRVVAALQRLGASPAEAWADYAEDAVLSPVADAVARSAESGSRMADSFERLAADRRAELVIEGESRARRAGVYAMAPLGLCFLPAFVSLGVAPLVISIATTVLGGVRT